MNVDRILAVAAAIEGNLFNAEFNMFSHQTCICGWGFMVAHNGEKPGEYNWWASDSLFEWLDLPNFSQEGRRKLFDPSWETCRNLDTFTRAEAVQMLRNLAATGKVVWA